MGGRIGEKLQDGKRRYRFARSRFAHQRDGFTLLDGKRDAIDRQRLSLPLTEGDGEIAYGEERLGDHEISFIKLAIPSWFASIKLMLSGNFSDVDGRGIVINHPTHLVCRLLLEKKKPLVCKAIVWQSKCH